VLPASEVVSLKVADTDSERMTLRVGVGNGRKDRNAMLLPVLLGATLPGRSNRGQSRGAAHSPMTWTTSTRCKAPCE
jgi:integrase